MCCLTRDVIITLEKLYEKLLNFKALLLTTKPEPSHFLATSNPINQNTPTQHPPANSSSNNSLWRPSNNNTNRYPTISNSKPTTTQGNQPSYSYLGYCQIYKIQGHIIKSVHYSSQHQFKHPTITSMLQIIILPLMASNGSLCCKYSHQRKAGKNPKKEFIVAL